MKKSFTDNRITARDLQIGDYFYLSPRHDEGYKVVRINSISRRKFGYVDDGGQERYIRYCEDRLRPIPFYEGFIFDTIFTDDTEMRLKMTYNLLKLHFAGIFELKYVHELQHFLNLRNSHNKFHLTVDHVLDYGKDREERV